jgi:hypothetical protein
MSGCRCYELSTPPPAQVACIRPIPNNNQASHLICDRCHNLHAFYAPISANRCFSSRPDGRPAGHFGLDLRPRRPTNGGSIYRREGREISVRLPPVAPEIYCAYGSNLAAELALLLHSLVQRVSPRALKWPRPSRNRIKCFTERHRHYARQLPFGAQRYRDLPEVTEAVIQTDCRCIACSWQSFGRNRDLL